MAGSASSGRTLIVSGYAAEAVGLVTVVATSGASDVPAAETIAKALLVIVGLLLPVAGMVLLRRKVDKVERSGRYGFALQAVGLLGLLVGVVLVVAVGSLSAFFASAAIVAAAAVSAVAGAALLRGHYARTGLQNTRGAGFLVIGTVLVFLGVGVIVASNIAFEYLISQAESTVYTDLGATVSAWGCVVAGYSFFVLYGRQR